MNSHALAVLEFARVVDLVAGYALSESGAARVRTLLPAADRAPMEREHARIAAVRALRASEGGWGPQPVPTLGRAVAKLRVAESTWTPGEARDVAVLLTSSARLRASVRDPRRPVAAVAVLAPLTGVLVSIPELERALAKTIDDDGTVRDDASPTLRRLRRELRGAEQDLVRTLERVIAGLAAHQQVPDASVTVRNGRYVIPVRRDARSAVGGIVHDTSATGATLFVEPPAGVEAANHIRELEIDAQREVDRILLELTDMGRADPDGLDATFDALSEFDSLNARARFADEFACAPVQFGAAGDTLTIVAGRHPLLLAQGIGVVPFDLALSAAERTMLVSGPNTGGKTVLLKAVGLFHALAQSGMPIPAGTGTSLPIVDDIFADVGDEQSIEASLSTFSAHLKNLREILVSATRESLVLIDELGSGTDPAEGAALGAAILEELTARGVRCLATTHLGALKDLPLTVPGVVNASLQFNEAELAPTYRLQQGIPGRSYGLSIARRLALPDAVISRAEARVPEQERAVSALLAELERRETELGVREATLHTDVTNASEHGRRIAERERAVRDRERDVERQARAEARRYLLEARGEVERTIASLRAASEAGRAAEERAARKGIERRADEHAGALASLDAEEMDVRRGTWDAGAPVVVGATVDVETLGGRTGRVVELRGDDAVVAVGAVKLTVPIGALRASARAAPSPAETIAMVDLPEHDARPEVDVRGVRVSEVDELVMASLDSAVRADLKFLRIIHGKGTGALRERVGEMLSKDVRVKAFRLGAWNEGGAGVTVVEFT
jgi:DNA mismatch repair protein MutS2